MKSRPTLLSRLAQVAGQRLVNAFVGAIALRKVIATQLIGVSPADPVVLGAVAAVLFAVAVIAAWAPARHASRINPAEALRTE